MKAWEGHSCGNRRAGAQTQLSPDCAEVVSPSLWPPGRYKGTLPDGRRLHLEPTRFLHKRYPVEIKCTGHEKKKEGLSISQEGKLTNDSGIRINRQGMKKISTCKKTKMVEKLENSNRIKTCKTEFNSHFRTVKTSTIRNAVDEFSGRLDAALGSISGLKERLLEKSSN